MRLQQVAITTVRWYHPYESSDIARESNPRGTIILSRRLEKIYVTGFCVHQ